MILYWVRLETLPWSSFPASHVDLSAEKYLLNNSSFACVEKNPKMLKMRSDKEMFDLILNFANQQDDIRAVILNGSRVNPEAKKDPFQDFDVACLVRNVAPFTKNPEIASYFGELMILQTPEDMGEPPPENDGHYAYLMQFKDGTRIDLSFYPLDRAASLTEDSLSLVLLDKDGLIPDLPPPSTRSYLPKPPDARSFHDCCNEFWWVSPYVAKGLWRDELTYARTMLEIVREQLMRMLTWYVGVNTGFQQSSGKMGKYLKKYLAQEMWAMLEQTYVDALPDHTWDALLTMGELFRRVAKEVAGHFHFTYPEQDDRNVTNYLHHIRKLPIDAEAIY
jgi:aminoglycoside 6-adenylyltransferase